MVQGWCLRYGYGDKYIARLVCRALVGVVALHLRGLHRRPSREIISFPSEKKTKPTNMRSMHFPRFLAASLLLVVSCQLQRVLAKAVFAHFMVRLSAACPLQHARKCVPSDLRAYRSSMSGRGTSPSGSRRSPWPRPHTSMPLRSTSGSVTTRRPSPSPGRSRLLKTRVSISSFHLTTPVAAHGRCRPWRAT